MSLKAFMVSLLVIIISILLLTNLLDIITIISTWKSLKEWVLTLIDTM